MSRHEDHFIRHQVRHSHALHSHLCAGGAYPVGPLAGFDLYFAQPPSLAQETFRGCEIAPPCRSQFRSIVMRAIEMILACHESLRILDAYEPLTAGCVLAELRRARGGAITEAPRGILCHRHEIEEITAAKTALPSSQNQKTTKNDSVATGARIVRNNSKQRRCDQSIPNHGPVISCATHLLNEEVPGL